MSALDSDGSTSRVYRRRTVKATGKNKYQLRYHTYPQPTAPALRPFTTMLFPLSLLLLHLTSTVAVATTKCLVSGDQDSINNALALGAFLEALCVHLQLVS